ncbi:MAG: monovalent cation/H(+) antiporter subunit G [Pseudomonadota bacterium]
MGGELLPGLIDIVSATALAAGGLFYLIGAIGLNRMPDVFTRMHAASVSETLGIGLLFLGMFLQAGFSLVAVKLVFILALLWLTAPLATHALARAALHDGEKPLLADENDALVAKDPGEVFPGLEQRLAEPLSSEQLLATPDRDDQAEEVKP